MLCVCAERETGPGSLGDQEIRFQLEKHEDKFHHLSSLKWQKVPKKRPRGLSSPLVFLYFSVMQGSHLTVSFKWGEGNGSGILNGKPSEVSRRQCSTICPPASGHRPVAFHSFSALPALNPKKQRRCAPGMLAVPEDHE